MKHIGGSQQMIEALEEKEAKLASELKDIEHSQGNNEKSIGSI
jgi:hypothetical protein